mmetsp:Transcript_19/g.28  ORF Transcript_19/g.28 Transcript_19/m.28 type:complete len:135 (+) Transcript_19:1-405(+)
MVGYGIAMLRIDGRDATDDNKPESKKGSTDSCNDRNDENTTIIQKYVSSTVMIACGLFLALPSLTSQIVWESLIPAYTATDVAQDLATDTVIEYIRSWKPETKWASRSIVGTSGEKGGRGASSSLLPSTSSSAE